MNIKIILAALLSVIALFVIIVISSYVGANNYGAKIEAELRASLEQNKNSLSQYEQRVMEMVQVPNMYKDDLKDVINTAMTGRYGEDGSKASMQWIREHSLNYDSKLYANIQDVIAGGRKDFENSQKRMIDIKRNYEGQLGSVWRGAWLRIAGFPKEDLSKYQAITTSRTAQIFEAGIEKAPLKLR